MKFDTKQKRYLLKFFEFIFICEVLLKIDNKIIQSLGIMLVPFIAFYAYSFLKSDKSNLNN